VNNLVCRAGGSVEAVSCRSSCVPCAHVLLVVLLPCLAPQIEGVDKVWILPKDL